MTFLLRWLHSLFCHQNIENNNFIKEYPFHSVKYSEENCDIAKLYWNPTTTGSLTITGFTNSKYYD